MIQNQRISEDFMSAFMIELMFFHIPATSEAELKPHPSDKKTK